MCMLVCVCLCLGNRSSWTIKRSTLDMYVSILVIMAGSIGKTPSHLPCGQNEMETWVSCRIEVGMGTSSDIQVVNVARCS